MTRTNIEMTPEKLKTSFALLSIAALFGVLIGAVGFGFVCFEETVSRQRQMLVTFAIFGSSMCVLLTSLAFTIVSYTAFLSEYVKRITVQTEMVSLKFYNEQLGD